MTHWLHPRYRCRLVYQDDPESTGQVLAIDTEPIPDGFRFEITSFSCAENYVLVDWRYGDGEEFITGQNLWKEQVPLAMTGGAFDFPLPQSALIERGSPAGIWGKVDARLGQYGMSQAIATKLTDFKNKRKTR